MGKTKITINNIIRRLRFDADEMTQKELAEREITTASGTAPKCVVTFEQVRIFTFCWWQLRFF